MKVQVGNLYERVSEMVDEYIAGKRPNIYKDIQQMMYEYSDIKNKKIFDKLFMEAYENGKDGGWLAVIERFVEKECSYLKQHM